MHENLHKNVNENMFSFKFYANFHEFYEGQLKQQICYSFILPFKMAVQYQFFANFDGPNVFFLNQQAPVPTSER